MTTADTGIMGGGMVGWAATRWLQIRLPGMAPRLPEKSPTVARRQSARNAGVNRARAQYAPGGLIARFCTAVAAAPPAFGSGHVAACHPGAP